jgi:hypothetical protein
MRGIGLAAIATGVIGVFVVSGCHASGTGETSSGSTRGSAAQAPMSQAQLAAKANADGEALMRDGKHSAAARKFMEAAARRPEVAYMINYCRAQFRAGSYEPALHACQGARNNEPSPAQRTEIEGLIRQILQTAKQQGIELCDGCIYEAEPDPPPH